VRRLRGRLQYADKDERIVWPDPQIVFAYDLMNFDNRQVAAWSEMQHGVLRRGRLRKHDENERY
jgi:hypothetical protein